VILPCKRSKRTCGKRTKTIEKRGYCKRKNREEKETIVDFNAAQVKMNRRSGLGGGGKRMFVGSNKKGELFWTFCY